MLTVSPLTVNSNNKQALYSWHSRLLNSSNGAELWSTHSVPFVHDCLLLAPGHKSCVGARVGAYVGGAVAGSTVVVDDASEGDFEGALVGNLVGSTVGASEGVTVGAAVGLVVSGSAVVVDVAPVGAALGESL